MSNELLPFNQRDLRGADSNSLLRLYDQANRICSIARSEQQRTRAKKAIQRLARELRKRKVPVGNNATQPSYVLA